MGETIVSAEVMAGRYWNKLKVRSIYEIQLKLSRYADATRATKEYWNEVLRHLTNKATQKGMRQ